MHVKKHYTTCHNSAIVILSNLEKWTLRWQILLSHVQNLQVNYIRELRNQTWSDSTRQILENSLPARAGIELDLQKSRYALFNCTIQKCGVRKSINWSNPIPSSISIWREKHFASMQCKRRKTHLAKGSIFFSTTK